MMRSWIKNIFKKQSKKHSVNLIAKPSLEMLEKRLTPTTVTSNAAGQIIITGTIINDNLTLSLNNNQLTITEANTLLIGTVFGVTAANNTVTIDFATNAAAKTFTGIKLDLLDSSDTLNITNGLDCRTLPVNPGNAIAFQFNGGSLNTGGTADILLFEGIVASKSGDINISNFSTINNNNQNKNAASIQAFNSNLTISNFQTNGGNQINIGGLGAIAFEATGNAKNISFDSNLQLAQDLTIRGANITDQVNITSFANPALTNSFNGNGILNLSTQGNINIQGAITLKNTAFIVSDTDNFTATSNVTASSISVNSNTGKSTTIISFNQNVITTLGDFTIGNLGNTTVSGAQFIINGDASTNPIAANQNLLFTVAGKLTAGTTGGIYDLYLCGNSTSVTNNITISNTGSLTLGTVNVPSTSPPNSIFTSLAGFFDASAASGPTFLFGDIISGLYVSIGGNIFLPSATSAPLAREFTIQAQNGNITVGGQIQLQDNFANNTLGSDLVLQAGVNTVDNGIISIQSVIGVNRKLTINDCQDFTAAGSIQVKQVVLQGTGGDANLGAGQYIFDGNIGLTTNPTQITANTGKYGIQILGSANVFGSLPPAVLSDFGNTGRVILGDNNSDTVNFTGGAIFRQNTQLAGTGVVSGTVRAQGALIPGNYSYLNSQGQLITNDIGTPTFNNALIFEEVNNLQPPDFRTAVYYADLLGNSVGINQDQIIANSGFVLNNNPILYPLLRTTSVTVGSQFTIVRLTDGSPVIGKFTGLVNQATNAYAVLQENDKFFAAGAQYQISYQGGDGNDVVVTFLGFGSGTNLFVDANNVLNVIGDNQASDVTAEVRQGSTVASLNLIGGGSGFNVNPVVTFGGASTISAAASTTLSIQGLAQKIITAIPLGLGSGTGYVINDTFQILGGTNPANFAVGKVTNVVGGAVTGITITTQGGGYDPANLINLQTNTLTGAGTGLVVNVVNSQVFLSSAGTGYTLNQNVTLRQGTNTTATARVTAVNGTGGITGITLVGNGSSYTDLTNLVITGSSTGNNATIGGFGSVDNLSLISGGTGYAASPPVSITNTNGFGQNASAISSLNNVLNVRDLNFGLIGFAYGSKVVNNTIDIQLFNPVFVGPNAFNGFNVQMNGGNDTLNLIKMDLVAANTINPNVANVFFSLNGGPTLTPNQDTDILNLIGTNQNVETGPTGSSTVLVQGYDFLRSRDSGTGLPSTGLLSSANQGNSSLKILGPVFYDMGIITLGSNNRADTTTSNTKNIPLVPSTSGTITLSSDAYVGNGASLNLGNGNASNLVLQSIKGTPGGLPSNLSINVSRFNSVQNGTNNTQVTNILGGNVTVYGSIGTDIGTFNITKAGITNFIGSVDAALINIQNNDGGINFKSTVGISSNPVINIGTVSLGSSIIFNGNLSATSFTTSPSNNLDFGIRFLGNTTTVTKNTNLVNTGGIILGDSNDTLNFLGGLNVDKSSPVEMYGLIQSSGTGINILSNQTKNLTGGGVQEIGFTLNGPSIIRTTFGPNGTSAPIQLGRMISNSNTLNVNSGSKIGSTITIDEARGDAGSLVIENSAGTTISQVGKFSTNNSGTQNEIFGTISILDSVNDINFNGGILLRNIITSDRFYNVIFQGSSDPTISNNNRLFLVLSESPTTFRNRGNVTLGINGADPTTLMDYFIFNGGLNTSLITGITNIGGNINTNNKDIVVSANSINASSLLNTYLSSISYDATPNGNIISIFNSNSSFLSPQLSQSAQAIILSLFGYPDSSRQLPSPVYPGVVGGISMGPINNIANTIQLNAGGLGSYGAIVGGDININSYFGDNEDFLRIYRAANLSIIGDLSGSNIYVGTLANNYFSDTTELTGLFSVQGNLTANTNFQISKDVNNVALLGNQNVISAENIFANNGYLQLGNSSTDSFNVSTNFNVRGPAERRIGGLFNITNGKSFDLGPSPTSLVADTQANTIGIGFTSFGAVTNNAFDFVINGTAQIQRYSNDSDLSPFPDPTSPSSYIPINNILGAGTGGGNVFLNGEIVIQEVKKTALTSINVTNAGNNYTRVPVVTIQGGGGSGATASASLGITNIVNVFGGTGYVVGDVVTLRSFFSAAANNATAIVNAIGASGDIQGLTLLSSGSGYTRFTGGLQINGGSGTGAFAFATGSVVSVSILNPGSGYSSAPQVLFGNVDSLGLPVNGSGAAATSTITTSSGFPQGNIINIPPQVNLKKQGTGNVTISTDSSANTAGLVTTIENGAVLYESGKINAATITNISNNGMLGGSNGTLGTVNVLPGGSLAPGNLTSPIGTLNLMGDLTIQGNYNVNIRSQAFNLFDRANVTGTVTLTKNGLSGVLNASFTNDANSIAVGNLFGIISNDGTDAVVGTFTNLPEGETTSITMPDGRIATVQVTYKGNILPTGTTFTGGNDVVLQVTKITAASSSQAQLSNFPSKLFAVSTDAGGGPVVKINFDNGSGFSFFAYAPTFTGGVRTAIGDINGDGQPDLVTAAGPGGGPHVVVWSINPSLSYATVQSGFFAFEPTFTGGITLSTGNLNGDTFDDIIVGAGAGGGPRVAAFAGNANYASNPTTRIADFFAYDPSFDKGVNVAAGDRTGDGLDEIITGAAQGGGPHVQVFNTSGQAIDSFFAFNPALTCGVFVAAGDLDSDGIADIYTGTGSGTTGTAGVFFGNGAVTKFEPFGQFFYGGVRVGAALGPVNQTGNTSVAQNFLIAAAGPGGGPQVSIFNGNLNLVDAFFAFPQNFTGGVLSSTTVNR